MSNDLFAPMDPKQLKGLRVIGLALAFGALLFAGVASALPLLGGDSPLEAPPDTSLVRILSMVHGFAFVSALTMASIVPSMLAARAPDQQRPGLFLVRWSIMEAAALLGTVIVLLAGLGGIVPDQPLYYANLTSTLALLMFVVMDTGRLSDAAKRG